ncbi:MYND-type domain-containing protein [Mycena sanguinolenta]|uniref:MYND-type domain-containing protein n=1 Tax=Mycena sanguinolenta TaxID=230812 RepID=A0A8H6Y1D8_9AGAR|nr:MYND-type domain-containing protein [Mycena sanguinolenta]
MHPSLNISNLARLPPSLRTRAIAAASGADLETLALVEDLEEIPSEQLPLLLPVFYACLDPAPISKIPANFDLFGWDGIKPYILQAYSSLNGIENLGLWGFIPPSACVELWDRIWPWIQFLEEYHECLTIGGCPRYAGFMSLICYLNGEASQLIHSTPGLYVVVGRAWRYAITESKEGALLDVSFLLQRWFQKTDWNPATFEELILGAGGTWMDLALVVVSHIKHVLPKPDSSVTNETGLHLVTILCIVAGDCGQDATFQNALLSCGIVTALTTAVRALCRSTMDVALKLQALFSTLVDEISSFSPTIWLPEALRAGLLEIMFTSQHRDSRSRVSISRHSPRHLHDRDAAAIFGDPALLARWQNLLTLVESRLSILARHDTEPSMVKACDNIECAKILPKQEFKRCGGCLNRYYCSKTCQANDWRRGEQRQTCGDFSLARIGYSHVSPRDRTFLCALTRHDYIIREEELTERQLLFIQQHPGEIPYIMFDFDGGTCEIEIGSLKDIMQLHLMKAWEGNEKGLRRSLVWAFPLRFGTHEAPVPLPRKEFDNT